MLKPQLLKPYIQSNIFKLILHFHFLLLILLDFVFDLFIKAQTLFQYMISNILILYSHKLFDILTPATESVLFIHILANKLIILLIDLISLLTNFINQHLRLCLTCGKLLILQSNLVWVVLGKSYNQCAAVGVTLFQLSCKAMNPLTKDLHLSCKAINSQTIDL